MKNRRLWFLFAVLPLFGALQSDLEAAGPSFPVGNYTLEETWRYEKSYSGLGRGLIRKEKDGRVLFIDGKTKRTDWVFYPNGKVTLWRTDAGKRRQWVGRWSERDGSVSITARSGVHSGSAVFQRVNSREWKMTGVHKVRGKKIGTGKGTLKRSP